jgi:phenylacetate-CoA ligase
VGPRLYRIGLQLPVPVYAMNKYLSRYLFYYPSTLMKGELIGAYLKQAREFQWLTTEEIEKYQLNRVRKLIRFALEHSPFYRERYKGVISSSEDIRSLRDLEKLPVLTKSDLIEHRERISTIWASISGSKVTGGSTGQPVHLKKNPSALARERAITWRSYEWAGIEIGDPQARFWGVPHTRLGKAKARVTDVIANRLRISAFDLTEESLASYYRKMMRFKPAYIYGYVSVIEMLADYVAKNGLPPLPSVRAVITTSEILTPSVRTKIQEMLGSPVFNEYGCGEVGSVAHECEHGNLHVMADNLYVEVDAGNESAGEILVTDFFNYAMPLIRYRVGDLGKWTNGRCVCGRGLPAIESICGRAYDLIHTTDGRKVHPEAIIYIFEALQKESGAFGQFQAIQCSDSEMLVKVVPTEKWSRCIEESLIERLMEYVDAGMQYRVDICDKIDREASGKMRLVKCELQEI